MGDYSRMTVGIDVRPYRVKRVWVWPSHVYGEWKMDEGLKKWLHAGGPFSIEDMATGRFRQWGEASCVTPIGTVGAIQASQ